jgi:hypothetical protein
LGKLRKWAVQEADIMANEEKKVAANTGETIDTVVKRLKDMPGVARVVLEELKDLTLRYVRRMRVIPYPDFDFNRHPFMSRIIVSELFSYAQEHPEEEVKMFIGDVKSEFYGDYLLFDRTCELAKKGIKFNVILAKPPAKQYLPNWQKLVKESSGNIRVRMKPQYSDKLCHLILVGGAYRKEAPHEDYEGEVTDFEPLRPARFAFHDEFYAQSNVLDYWRTEVDIDDVQELPVAY